MHYTLHQLQVFLKVAQLKSVTKAADELHMTQPAVSIQLRNLQDQFDIPLTEVIGRRLYVTDFGNEILQIAERIINEMHAINYKTMAFKGHLSGKLKISAVSTGKYIIPYFITDFMNGQEGIELNLDVTNKSKVIASLENNEVDFALVSVLPEKLKVEKVELMPNKLFLVGSMERRWKKSAHSASILNELPVIFREEGSGTRRVLEMYMSKNKLPVHKKFELTSNEAVKQAVIAGLGYSVMPLIGLKNELKNKDLQIINLKGFPIRSTWYLIWLKNKRFSPVAQAFLQFLRKEKERIINEKFNWLHHY